MSTETELKLEIKNLRNLIELHEYLNDLRLNNFNGCNSLEIVQTQDLIDYLKYNLKEQ